MYQHTKILTKYIICIFCFHRYYINKQNCSFQQILIPRKHKLQYPCTVPPTNTRDSGQYVTKAVKRPSTVVFVKHWGTILELTRPISGLHSDVTRTFTTRLLA